MGEELDPARLTHVDPSGEAHMVDVTDKAVTMRVARASAKVRMAARTLELVRQNQVAKGDVLGVARLAGIMAAKRTSELIPLCHGLPLSAVAVSLAIDGDERCIRVEAECRTEAKTGVEMEALTAVSVAGLTVYDMCKSADRQMEITEIRLIYKSGGRSGTHQDLSR